jgi:hypothetical protein
VAIVFKNNAKTTLAGNVTTSATSITVSDGSVFPAISGGDTFFCTFDDGTNNEIVSVTAISGNVLTVVRAQDNTTAKAFTSGDAAESRLTAGILDTFSQVDSGEVTADEFIGDLRGAVIFKAQASEAVSKGDAVYVSGISGNTPVVSLADADLASKMPAFGLVLTAASANGSTEIVTFGTISGIDTSAFSVGDTLYIGTTAGELTNSKPTGESSLIQNIGKVQRSHASSGSIKVGGAGRTNDTPNLNDGNIFIGNASNQATTASLNTKIEAYLDANGTTFPDNVKAQFGAGNDLQIYHDGSHSHIINATGDLTINSQGDDLILKASDDFLLQVQETDIAIQAVGDGKVGLRYNNAEKLATTSTGIDVTGTATMDGLTVSATTATVNITGGNTGASLINFGDAADGNVGRIYYDHTADFMQFKAADGERLRINSTGIDVTGTIDASGDITTTGNYIADTHFRSSDSNATLSATGGGGVYLRPDGNSNSANQVFIASGTGNATFSGTLEATSFSDGTISGITFIDEDSFATNSATRVPTQQSIKAYVDAEVAGVVDSAPAALNTLNELAAALGDDANFSTTTSDALGNRLRVDTASQGLTGTQQANAITNLGITATKAELNYVDGVTSNIQNQISARPTVSTSGYNGTYNIPIYSAPGLYTVPNAGGVTITGSTGQITTPNHGNSSQWNSAYTLTNAITATTTELNYTDGVTSNIQTQLNTKITSSDNITGTAAGLSGTPNITVGTISSGAITSTSSITSTALFSNNISSSPDKIGNIKISRVNGAISDIDNLDTFIFSKTDGTYPSGTKPAGSHNGTAILSFQTHSGNYFTQLALSTNTNDLFIRSANDSSSFGSYSKLLKENFDIAVGTISSGAITSTGALTLSVDTTDCINISSNSTNNNRGISFNNRSALTADYNDGYLRLNNNSEFTNGVFTPDNIRADGYVQTGALRINTTTIMDSARNLTNVNLVKFRDEAASFYISPTNANTLNAQYGTTADSADMWINYRGYADGFTKFRDFRIGNGKGAALLHVDGSASTFDFQSGSTLKMNGTTFIDANRNITVGNITSSGTLSVGSYFKAGTTVAAGFYQDSLNGAYRANGTTSTRGFYFQSNAGVSNTMYVGLVGTYAGRVGVGTTAPAEQFHATGAARVGSLKVGTATVFDTSRNMANLGNITSGGILDIPTLHIRGDGNTGYTESSLVGGISLWSTGASTSQIMFKPTSSGSLGNHGFCTATYNTYFVMDTTNRGWVFRNASTNTNVASISNNGGASFNNGIKINATTIVDANRNLTNIGSINATGTSTTPFIFTGTGSSLIHEIGSATQTQYASTKWRTNDGLGQIWKTGSAYSAWGGADALNIYNSNGSIAFHPSATANVLKLTSTGATVTGTITSGAIDSTDGFMTFETSDTNGYARFTAANGSAQLGLFRSGSSVGGMYIGADINGLELRNSNFAVRATLSPTGVFNVVDAYQINGTTVINNTRQIQSVTFADALYTDEYGKSLVGNFGQFQDHSAYNTGFNSSVAMWGWNYVQSNTNAPNTTSSQWYRNRVSLGDDYGYNYDSNDYWLEMAYPRYSSTSAGHMWTRACEGGTVGGWSQVGSNIVGNFVATGNVTAYSDRRLKENIQTLDSKKALQMRGVSFIKDGVEGSGVIAQEIEEIAPELVLTADDEMGTKSVAYGNLVGYLIEAIKDQQKEIEYMKSEIKTLKEKNNGD